MTANDTHARELLEVALQKMRQGDVAAAIELYDCAAGASGISEDVAELITIRKAEAWIALEQDGPEVSQLPQIVMRRRNAYHVYLAAYTLLRKFADQGDRRRALFYGQLARTAAEELGDARARANVLNGVGVTLTIDSQFEQAIAAFEEGISVAVDIRDEAEEAAQLRVILRGNLAGALILNGDAVRGVPMLENVLPQIGDDYNATEGLVDLAFGCMQLERYDKAEAYAMWALDRAVVPRQVRNANHALGEVAMRTGQFARASGYYDVVATYYPDFNNVKELLLAVDVLSVVNWKV